MRCWFWSECFGRLPAPVGKGFAAVLDFATVPFDAVNYWGSRCGATVFDHRRMGPKLDRVVASLQRHLRRESAADLARSMSYPTRWDPFFTPTMTLADIYHYPTQHFDFHRQQLSGSFRRADGGPGAPPVRTAEASAAGKIQAPNDRGSGDRRRDRAGHPTGEHCRRPLHRVTNLPGYNP